MTLSPRRKPDPRALQRRIHALEAELAAVQRLGNELRESEERLRILTEATGETIAIIERGVVVECNQQVLPMFGYEVADAIGRPALDFVAPAARELVTRNIQTGYELPYEALGLRRDGRTFPALFRGKQATFRGRPARVTVVRDLTGRDLLAAHEAAAQSPMALLPLAPGVVLLPLVGIAPPACLGHALARIAGAAAAARIVLIDLSAVLEPSPAHLDVLRALAGELARAGARTIVTGAPETLESDGLERRPSLQDAVREVLSSGT